MTTDEASPLLRHLLATLAYRTQKAVRGSPEAFGDFTAGAGSRTPKQIVHHMTGLLVFSRRLVEDHARLHEPRPLEALDGEVRRFHRELERLEDALASRPSLDPTTANRVLQGPLSDALTHVGQLAFLRRLAGSPLPGEDFSRAEIHADRLGVDQPRALPREARIRAALEWISQVLDDLEIPFQVAGGLAAIAHGSDRPLHDIDLYVPSGALERIVPRVEEHRSHGPRRVQSDRWDCLLLDLHHSGEEIELADAARTRYRAGRDGPWFQAEVDFANPARRRAFGVDLPVMPLEDLLRYKRRLGRAVDREDVAHLTTPPTPPGSTQSQGS